MLNSSVNDNNQPTFLPVTEKAAVASSATLALFLSHHSFGSTLKQVVAWFLYYSLLCGYDCSVRECEHWEKHPGHGCCCCVRLGWAGLARLAASRSLSGFGLSFSHWDGPGTWHCSLPLALPVFRVLHVEALSAFCQFTRSAVGVARLLQNRPNSFARCKYLILWTYEPPAVEKTFHYCQSFPSSCTNTFAGGHLQLVMGVLSHSCENPAAPSFPTDGRKKKKITQTCRMLKFAAALSNSVLVFPLKDFWMCQYSFKFSLFF